MHTDPNPLAHLFWWFEIHTGTAHETKAYYGFWSGFAGDLTIFTSAVAGIIVFLRHHNCHDKGCLRLGKHQTPDGFKLCKKHVGKSKEELNLHTIHEDHR